MKKKIIIYTSIIGLIGAIIIYMVSTEPNSVCNITFKCIDDDSKDKDYYIKFLSNNEVEIKFTSFDAEIRDYEIVAENSQEIKIRVIRRLFNQVEEWTLSKDGNYNNIGLGDMIYTGSQNYFAHRSDIIEIRRKNSWF